MSSLQKDINDLHSRYRDLDDGQLASYIPKLAKADPSWFGILSRQMARFLKLEISERTLRFSQFQKFLPMV